MYCEKCGNKLLDEAKFCEKCGTSTVGEVNQSRVINEKVRVEDNDILLQVKSKFKLIYFLMGIAILPIILGVFAAFITWASMSVDSDIAILRTIATWFVIVCTVIILVSIWFTKKQYKSFEYNFYRTKLIYHDSFINITEKEIKYKYIREVQMTQSFVQRWFNIGKILIYTNAESGMGNGINIVNAENPKETYANIKKVIDGGN